MLRWLLIWLALAAPAYADGLLLGLGVGSPPVASASAYTGPGDIVSGATAWYGLRAYNAAYAATPGKSVNVRRASDNVACDINVATTGGLGLTTATCNSSTQGGVTPTAFAGTDATATCTLASTTATCAGASSTPHVGSTITGASLTQPCLITAVGTFTGGAGTLTTSLAGTSTSCGTISVGETFTMTYGLLVTEAYDQTGNGVHVLQATAGNQPQLLPTCVNSLPCFFFVGASTQFLASTATISQTQPYTESVVLNWLSGLNVYFLGNAGVNGSNYLAIGANTSSTAIIHANSPQTPAITTTQWNSISVNYNAASSAFYGNGGAGTSENLGSSVALAGIIQLGENGRSAAPWNGFGTEGGYWPVGMTSTQADNLCHNEFAYWATAVSC